jgi:hypothetical protein
VLREVGFFDVYPADDLPSYNGAWTSYPFFASGSVAVNGIEQGLFVLSPRVTPQGQATGLDVSVSGPASAATDSDWSFLVTVANHGPDRLSQTRVLETPPGDAQLLSARSSQGQCSTSAIATCDLGSLAPGSRAHVVVTVRPAGAERDFISTAVASARADDGSAREASALTTTRGVRHAPALTLRRPTSGTTFWLARNNTIQWALRGVTGGVAIDLSRNDGQTWTRLVDQAENVGFYDWTGAGELTSLARIRISSVARPELTQTSPSFTIGTR